VSATESHLLLVCLERLLQLLCHFLALHSSATTPVHHDVMFLGEQNLRLDLFHILPFLELTLITLRMTFW
jgi:hypothetical protein